MKKIKGKNIKNKIILGVITVLLMLINLIIIKFFVDNKKSIFITWGILTVFFLIYRLLIFIIQKILIKINVLKYIPDYFANDEFKKLREKLNVEHQQAEDRIFLALVYNISFIILMAIFIKFLNNEGIIISIISAIIIAIPTILFSPIVTNKLTGYERFGDPSSYNFKPTSTKIKATTWNFGFYSETTYRDEFGKTIGKVTSFDWGPVKDTTLEDEHGNKTEMEHWKF